MSFWVQIRSTRIYGKEDLASKFGEKDSFL